MKGVTFEAIFGNSSQKVLKGFDLYGVFLKNRNALVSQKTNDFSV